MASVKLPALPVNWQEQPQLLERYWNDAMKSIEKSLNAVLSLPEIKAAINAANAAAAAANAAANNASAAAASTAQETSLINSYVTGFAPPLIKATSDGQVTIATHRRVYGDSSINPTVAVNGATIATGAIPGSTVRIYYVDPSRSGGTVTYLFTIDGGSDPPVQTGATHSVGVVTIPNTGTGSGTGIKPPGYVLE